MLHPQSVSASPWVVAARWSVISWYGAVSVQGPRVLGTVTVLRLVRITGYQRPRIRTASPGVDGGLAVPDHLTGGDLLVADAFPVGELVGDLGQPGGEPVPELPGGRAGVLGVPGVVTQDGEGPDVPVQQTGDRFRSAVSSGCGWRR